MTVTNQPAYSALLLEERPHVFGTTDDNEQALRRIDDSCVVRPVAGRNGDA